MQRVFHHRAPSLVTSEAVPFNDACHGSGNLISLQRPVVERQGSRIEKVSSIPVHRKISRKRRQRSNCSHSLFLSLSPSLSSQKRTFIRREQVAREHSRWFLAGEKLVEIFLFLRSTRSSLLFPVRITLQVFLILRVPSAMNLSLFLSLPQALFTCFRPGTSVPVSGLQVVSGTRNHCPLAVRFRGRVQKASVQRVMGSAGFFSPLSFLANGRKKRKGTLAGEPLQSLANSFIRGEWCFEGVAFPAVDSAEECWVIPLVQTRGRFIFPRCGGVYGQQLVRDLNTWLDFCEPNILITENEASFFEQPHSKCFFLFFSETRLSILLLLFLRETMISI